MSLYIPSRTALYNHPYLQQFSNDPSNQSSSFGFSKENNYTMSDSPKNDSPSSLVRNFTLPVKIPFEELLSKYSSTLDITVGGYKCDAFEKLDDKGRVSFTNDNKKDKITNNDRDNVTTRSKVSRKADNGNDEKDNSSDCVIISDSVVNKFKAPYKTLKKAKLDIATETTPNASKSTNLFTKRTAKRKKEMDTNSDDPQAKPGTLGSRQTLSNPSKENKTQINVLNNDLIDTRNMVTADMIVSLKEFCQRAKIKNVPDDPIDLLMKFSLIIPKLSEMDTLIGDK